MPTISLNLEKIEGAKLGSSFPPRPRDGKKKDLAQDSGIPEAYYWERGESSKTK